MRCFTADLHVHSCLSPCAELDMTPGRIIERAAGKNIDILAIADHNSAENIAVSVRTGLKRGVTVIPAMEITSSEEAHVLALFGEVEHALRMQDVVYENLSSDVNDERLWGEQVVVNEFDEVLGFNRRLLIGATSLPLSILIEKIHSIGGIAVASHVDRESFSVISQLGFIPENLGIDAIEVVRPDVFPGQARFQVLTNSDAHRPGDIGKRTTAFRLERPSFEEISLALKGAGGRSVGCP